MLALLVAIGALALARESGGDGQPADDAARVREAVETIRIAIQLDDWKTVYLSFADEFHEQCKEADYVAGATEQAPALKELKLEVGEVAVQRDSATASITFSNGEQTSGVWTFVREDGDWRLVSPLGTVGCGFPTPTPVGTPTPTGTP